MGLSQASRERPIDFVVGDVIESYMITSVRHNNEEEQVLTAHIMGPARTREALIRVLKTNPPSGQLVEELAWFRNRRFPSAWRVCSLEQDLQYRSCRVLIFQLPAASLNTVLATDSLWPLPRCHVREIAIQIILAVLALHNESRYIGILDAASIEFPNFFVTQEIFFDTGIEDLTLRNVLRSTEIRLSYFGLSKATCMEARYADSYRAPETLLGWSTDESSDAFSIGSLIAALTDRRLRLVCCPPGPKYIAEMVYQCQEILGPYDSSFLSQLAEEDDLKDLLHISSYFGTVEPTFELSEKLKNSLENPVLVHDGQAAALVGQLSKSNAVDRIGLEDALLHEFFYELTPNRCTGLLAEVEEHNRL